MYLYLFEKLFTKIWKLIRSLWGLQFSTSGPELFLVYNDVFDSLMERNCKIFLIYINQLTA